MRRRRSRTWVGGPGSCYKGRKHGKKSNSNNTPKAAYQTEDQLIALSKARRQRGMYRKHQVKKARRTKNLNHIAGNALRRSTMSSLLSKIKARRNPPKPHPVSRGLRS